MQTIDLTTVKKEIMDNHTSKGNQPKWHINKKWYKADHMGYEALAEYVISELLKKSNVEQFVVYELVKIRYDDKESIGCLCEDFKAENEMLIPLERLHRQYFGKGLADALAPMENAKERLRYTVNFVEQTTGIKDADKYFAVLLAVDTFFLNEDRHTNNIAVLRDEKTKTFRFAPIFDNGLALLSDTNDYLLETDLYQNIEKVQAKPFDTNFDEQLNAVEELYGSRLKFQFNSEDIYRILDELQGIYDKKILKRVERLLLEQKRKYQYFF